MGWDEFMSTLKGRLGYTNLPELLDKRMTYRQWEHVVIKMAHKMASLAVVEAAQLEGDSATFNPSVHVMGDLRP